MKPMTAATIHGSIVIRRRRVVKNRIASTARRRYDSSMLPNDIRPIGETLFIDGTTRTVFEDADGRQFVVAADGEYAYGVWLYVDDAIVISIDTQCHFSRMCGGSMQ